MTYGMIEITDFMEGARNGCAGATGKQELDINKHQNLIDLACCTGLVVFSLSAWGLLAFYYVTLSANPQAQCSVTFDAFLGFLRSMLLN